MFNNKNEMIETLYSTLPYSNQICDLDTMSEDYAIRFTWRSDRFRLSINGGVDEVGNGVIIGSNITILMREMIKTNYYSKQTAKS